MRVNGRLGRKESRKPTAPLLPAFAVAIALSAVGAALVLLPNIGRRPRDEEPGLSGLSPDGVYRLLEGVEDPELGISIVDLGLVRDVEISGRGEVRVTMILTSPFCPYNAYIRSRVRARVLEIEAVCGVQVVIDRSVRWSPDLMSAKGKAELGWPPGSGAKR
jgi:metal-sulfur cluster biosynthetic enzyme